MILFIENKNRKTKNDTGESPEPCDRDVTQTLLVFDETIGRIKSMKNVILLLPIAPETCR